MKYAMLITGIFSALILAGCKPSGTGLSHCTVTDGVSVCSPGASKSSPATLTVDAGSDEYVTEGDAVTLSGSAVLSKYGVLTHEWTQLSGPAVTLRRVGYYDSQFPEVIRFVTPAVQDTDVLVFQYKAKASGGVKNTDTVRVTVVPTSATALCLEAPSFQTSYAWANSGCTINSTDIVGDSRTATVYRQSESEPNDSRESANPLTFPLPVADERFGTSASGSVSGVGGDLDDYYVFTVPETRTYTVYLCNDPLICTRGTIAVDWSLSLSDQDFRILDSTTPNTRHQMDVTLELEAGLPYYVGVHVDQASTPNWDYSVTILSDDN
jgi:hypothetical protein